MKLYSNTIIMREEESSGNMLTCRRCYTELCHEEQEWKKCVKLDERPLAEVVGEAYSSTSQDVLYRQFYCPGCGSLLDSEIALQGDPYLKDSVWS